MMLVVEEYDAGAEIKPGMLVALSDAETVIPHATADGNVIPMFATENEFQGKTVNDVYAIGDRVQVWTPGRGDVVVAIAGGTIAVGDFLVSAGNGKLKAGGTVTVPTGGGTVPTQIVVGQALTAAAADKFVLVKIV